MGRFALGNRFLAGTLLCQNPFFHIVRLLLGLLMGERNKAEEVLSLVLFLLSAHFLCRLL